MLAYNLATEYATLAMIVVILISFLQDFERDNNNYRFLSLMYITAFFSSLFTLLANEFGASAIKWGEYFWYVPFVYFTTVVYFILIPALTFCYLLFCMIITSPKRDPNTLMSKFCRAFFPYGIYIMVILLNLTNGGVFTVNSVAGYVRGPLFQAPYIIAALNILLIIIVIGSARKKIRRESVMVIFLNMVLAFFLLWIQFSNPQIIMTGLCNTLTVLALHLYTQNSRKTMDPLTGIKNSMSLRYTLEDWIKKQGRFSLYVFSIRGFKSINERNGLQFGDRVLVAVSQELLNVLPYQIVYRYGGDEFAVLLRERPENEETIKKILAQFEYPIDVDGIDQVQLELVCARVDSGLFGNSSKELISALDFSVSLLKQTHGEPRYLYDPNVVKQLIDKSNMIHQIKEAIDHRMFQVAYQPIYSAALGSFTQAEALVRMKDTKGGLIPPSNFIDVAEVTGLVVPMTFVILDIVCEDLRRIFDTLGEDHPLQSISVNFSYLLFLSPHLEEDIMEILNRHRIEPKHIKIEITERTLISDEQHTSNVMDRLQELGFVFELDDFGVDYSNMSTLLNLPLDIVKIDRSVLLSALDSAPNMEFFHHLVAGIGVIGRIIIVEGVETKDQLDFVLECGCEYIQGFYFSRPLLFDDFTKYIDFDAQKKLIGELVQNAWLESTSQT